MPYKGEEDEIRLKQKESDLINDNYDQDQRFQAISVQTVHKKNTAVNIPKLAEIESNI